MADTNSPPVTEEANPTGVSPKKSIGTVTFGVVAADKELNSRTIKAYPQEYLPYASGELEATEVKTKVGMEDDRVGKFEGEANLTNTITAEYFDLATNRVYPPDMRRNEQVLLINLYDSDTWYWLPLGRNDNLRRNERYRLAVSDDVAFTKELTNDNTYYIELDTLENKHFVISTSKSDNEKYRYLIKIDAKLGTVQICDDIDNLILLESEEHHLLMRNTDGSCIDINKRIATVFGVDDTILKGGRQVVIEAPRLSLAHSRDMNNTSAVVLESKNLHINTSESMVIDSPSIGANGQVTIPNTLITKYIRSEGHVAGRVEPASSGTNKTSLSSMLTAAASLFTTYDAATSTNVSAQSYTPDPIDANRPTTLQTVFKDGKDALNLSEAMNYTGVDSVLKGYTGCAINIKDGSATIAKNIPNTFDITNTSNRQCAAWDQLSQGLDRISEGFRNIREAVNSLGTALERLGGDSELISTAKDVAKAADALGIEARVLGVNSRMGNMGGD